MHMHHAKLFSGGLNTVEFEKPKMTNHNPDWESVNLKISVSFFEKGSQCSADAVARIAGNIDIWIQN